MSKMSRFKEALRVAARAAKERFLRCHTPPEKDRGTVDADRFLAEGREAVVRNKFRFGSPHVRKIGRKKRSCHGPIPQKCERIYEKEEDL